jgi:large subunit ribosomal protein L17
MPQPKKGPRLGSSPSHQRLILRNLARDFFNRERVRTTEAKAKMLRPFAERLITRARKGSLHDRRIVLREIEDQEVVTKLFDEIGPRFGGRNGGYTRIVKLGPRHGDAAPMAIVELVEEGPTTASEEEEGEGRKRRSRGRARRRAAAPEKAQAEAGAEEEGPEETPESTEEPADDSGPAAEEPDAAEPDEEKLPGDARSETTADEPGERR